MRDVLRFITCGGVDDGKSTLTGRLLLEANQVFTDELEAVAKDSVRFGSLGGAPDLALLVDGLQAERDQGITIDVAYRYFATSNRRFILADTPGHEQFTRNMATAASTAQLAVILVDARKGVVRQTRRHSRIVALLGVTHVVLAVNKMDLVSWQSARFDAIVRTYHTFAEGLGLRAIHSIPLSALSGDNVTRLGVSAPWYGGKPLLEYLESAEFTGPSHNAPFRMPVQVVNRSADDVRGYCGRVAAGSVRIGDRVRICPGFVETTIKGIAVFDKALHEANAGRSVTLTFTDDVDASRGTVLASVAAPVAGSESFEAHLVWFSDRNLVVGRSYLLKIHSTQVTATVTEIKHVLDVDTGERCPAKTLELNDIGVVRLAVDRSVPFQPYRECHRMGAFILIDHVENDTVGGGMIDFAPQSATSVKSQALAIGGRERADAKYQRPLCVWLTGLPGAGKSTIANLLDERLYAHGLHTYVIDGDSLRRGLNRDLGFTEAARVENVRRAAEVARLMVDAGLIVIVSLISPFRSDRRFARALFSDGDFIEVHIDAPQAVCECRDPKGLYAKARRGELPNLTGIGSAYEAPENPDVRVRTDTASADECVSEIFVGIEARVTEWRSTHRREGASARLIQYSPIQSLSVQGADPPLVDARS
jgi:bifunctional enzyme CysN/CysC